MSLVAGLPTALSRTFPRLGGRNPTLTIDNCEWHFRHYCSASLQNPVSVLDSTSQSGRRRAYPASMPCVSIYPSPALSGGYQKANGKDFIGACPGDEGRGCW